MSDYIYDVGDIMEIVNNGKSVFCNIGWPIGTKVEIIDRSNYRFPRYPYGNLYKCKSLEDSSYLFVNEKSMKLVKRKDRIMFELPLELFEIE